MAASNLTAARLRELLDYDPETGAFTWRVPRQHRPAGLPAGTKTRIGYLVIRVDGHVHNAHRLAWLHMTGEFPAATIDHMDGDKSNNRWVNLRDVPQRVNSQNHRKAQGSAGLLGACWNKRTKNWRAVITVDDKQVHVGTFPTPELAHAAYVDAKRRLHEGCTL